MRRRTALQLLGAGLAAAFAPRRLFADATAASPDDYFIIIHAAGGWDVTLWSDPRNERRGLIEPASTANTDIAGLKHWKSTASGSFEIVTPPGSSLQLGPGIGDLVDLHDRITILNGIAMNTVSHDDGTVYSITGRHRAGSTIPAPSVDVVITSELGAAQLMPDVSIRFPSSFVGDRLDRRAVPLRVGAVDALGKLFARTDSYFGAADRTAISRVLAAEAHELAGSAADRSSYEQLAGEHAGLPQLLAGDFPQAFAVDRLLARYPTLTGPARTEAAFALEAIKRDVVRCVAFASPGFDSHSTNYLLHARRQQELFGLISALVQLADTTPHPRRAAAKLSEHLHILVLSEFCRTPNINLSGGRDHYPNNSALVVSPRFKPGVFGQSDPDQLLPRDFPAFGAAHRALTPPDVLATFVGAFGIDAHAYVRDGEVVRSLLKTG